MAFEGTEVKLDDTVNSVRENFELSVKSLERSVANSVESGADVNAIQGLYNTFNSSIQTNFEPLVQYGAELGSQFDEGMEPQDLVVSSQLLRGAELQVQSESESSQSAVIALLVLAGVIGEDAALTKSRMAGKISGVFLDTTDPNVISAQNRLAKLYASNAATTEQIRAAIDVIRKQTTGIDLSNSLRTTLRGAVSDAVYDFHGAFVLAKASRLGYSKYQYRGGVVRNSRDFCINHVNQTYTESEIRRKWRGSWQGKRPGDPFVVRGGYNCRHYWVPTK
jgi:hypothetical protein